MKRYDNWCRADEGMRFVLTALGKAEVASYRNYEIGKPVSEYDEEAPNWAVDNGYVIEVEDPDFVTLPGYRAVYDHKGNQICAGNPITYHDREMAELAANEFNNRPWNRNENKAYVIEAMYKGKRPIPCRQYEGKTVYNWSYWSYDRPIGSLVEEEIVNDLMDCLPPLTMRDSCMQTSEPSSCRLDEETNVWKNTYTTFKKVADGIYEYCGDCFKGENVKRGKEQQYVA